MEGRLKGFDTLVNLVLDECIEYIRGKKHAEAALYSVTLCSDPDDPYKLTNETRQLGLIVCRGTAVTLVCPCDGMMEIANPFISAE